MTLKTSKGYIYVASLKKLYYELGIESATSLRDLYPEANITLFTHETFIDDDRPYKIFDNVVTNIPIHRRAKMWCMARTPYDYTFYNDCAVHGHAKFAGGPLTHNLDIFSHCLCRHRRNCNGQP